MIRLFCLTLLALPAFSQAQSNLQTESHPASQPAAVQTSDAEDDYDRYTIRASDIPADAPRFEQFMVREQFTGPVAKPDVKSHPRSRMFRTRIREGAESGPNFAGHYTIVFWGCGSGCISLAIVDAKTGRVFHPDSLDTVDSTNVAYDEFDARHQDSVQFQKDSKLIVVVGGINEEDKRRGISYFVWNKEKLRRIRFVHKPYGW